MADSITRQSTTISRYRSKRQKSRALSNDASTTVSQSSPTIGMPNVMGMAIPEPLGAADVVAAIAVRLRDDHTKTSTVPEQVNALRDVVFRTPAQIHFTDSAPVSVASDT